MGNLRIALTVASSGTISCSSAVALVGIGWCLVSLTGIFVLVFTSAVSK
ncbi:MAG: hypothetical protein WC797_03300 [Candidatus Paceibacterota bacterium]